MLRTVQDDIFSKIVRTRDNFTCQRCGKVHPPKNAALHCSHYYTRGAWNTRFDLENAESLCYGCHRYFDGHKSEYKKFKIKRMGRYKFDKLTQRSNKAGKKKYLRSKEHTKILRNILKELQNE